MSRNDGAKFNETNRTGANKNYLSCKEACKFTGLEGQTLRRLGDSNAIACFRLPSGQRRFSKTSLEKFCDSHANGTLGQDERRNFIYARVSSKKQLDDLSRQVAFLRGRQPAYAQYTALTDVASGINFKRKGLQTILDACLQGTVGEVVVAHRDRLCRFAYDLVEGLVSRAGGRVIVIADSDTATEQRGSSEQELAEDLLSIVHVYSCRQMGKRKYTSGSKRDGDETAKKSKTAVEAHCRAAEDSGELAAHK
jgi:predicted site-specific integrase-resolvase